MGDPSTSWWSQRELRGPVTSVVHQQRREIVVRDHPRLICKSCYFERVEGRLWVFCKSHRWHKQAQKWHWKLNW